MHWITEKKHTTMKFLLMLNKLKNVVDQRGPTTGPTEFSRPARFLSVLIVVCMLQ